MTMPAAHPSHEALAALAAGANGTGGPGSAGPEGADLAAGGVDAGASGPAPGRLGRAQEHVGRCERCRDEVELLKEGTAALAMLGEPEFPSGLHDRLVAAVRDELAGDGAQRSPARVEAAGTAAGQARDKVPGEASVVDLATAGARTSRRARSARRWLGWSTAAAAVIVLAVAGIARVEQFSGGGGAADSAAGGAASSPYGQQAPTAGAAPGAAPPRFVASGDYSLARLNQDLATRPDMRAAYGTAYAQALRTSAFGSAESAPTSTGASDSRDTAKAAPDEQRSSSAPQGDGAGADRCGLTGSAGAPALVIDSSYRGQPATLVVAVKGDPPTVVLRAFSRDTCTLIGSEDGPAPSP